jgi:peptidoglycan/xylan/chitin deacetylase (PgdA/CDA1 family)
VTLRILTFLSLISGLTASAADEGVRVSILGYHDFSETDEETEMKIRTSKFQRQMEAIRDLGLNVVSMEDFQAWKRGDKSIPDKSIVITIDDGWKSVYDDAYPILKEMGYPFTLFLYKAYVDGGGKALTTPMIEEMMKNGATIGSHAVSHPYPAQVKQHRKKGPDAFDKFLRGEMGESKRFLESKFGEPVTTYAYPGGFQTNEMFKLGEEFGYQQLFTVLPGKVRRDTINHSIPRYVILGTHDHIFDLATAFNDAPGASSGDDSLIGQTTPFPVQPEPGALIEQRLPLISADLSEAGPIDPETITMQVGGFGKVPAKFDPETGTYSWQVNRHLRAPSCQVKIAWKTPDGKPPEVPLRWNFRIDQEAAYIPQN